MPKGLERTWTVKSRLRADWEDRSWQGRCFGDLKIHPIQTKRDGVFRPYSMHGTIYCCQISYCLGSESMSAHQSGEYDTRSPFTIEGNPRFENTKSKFRDEDSITLSGALGSDRFKILAVVSIPIVFETTSHERFEISAN